MLVVKTTLQPSPIHGLGCFAAQFIKKGEVVWVFDKRIEIVLSENEVSTLPEAAQDLFRIHGYANLSNGEKFLILCGDNARFMNHADQPNTEHKPGSTDDIEIAVRDIQPGDEITCNYYSFDVDAEKKLAVHRE